MTWRTLTKNQRVYLVLETWTPECSADSLASAISRKTSSSVSRHAILGMYSRNPGMRETHPLGGYSSTNYKGRYPEPKVKRPTNTRRGRPRRSAEGQNPAIMDAPVYPRLQLKISAASKAYDETSLRIPLDQLGQRQCHWPVGDPAPGEQHLFCGHPTEIGQRYCPNHQSRSTTKKKTQ